MSPAEPEHTYDGTHLAATLMPPEGPKTQRTGRTKRPTPASIAAKWDALADEAVDASRAVVAHAQRGGVPPTESDCRAAEILARISLDLRDGLIRQAERKRALDLREREINARIAGAISEPAPTVDLSHLSAEQLRAIVGVP